MCDIHKGEKSDVGIRQKDAGTGETNGEIMAENKEEYRNRWVYETGTAGEKGIRRTFGKRKMEIRRYLYLTGHLSLLYLVQRS